jgi:uncharacterized membrane-anchored protein YitT (DUF2179 family)
VSTDPDAFRDPHEHTLLEDAYALISGTTLIAIGLVLMKEAGIVTAGIAGVALLVSYAVPLGVGLLFFLLNIPFFVLGMQALGREFMVKSVLAALLIFGLASVAQESLEIRYVHPAFAALAGGTCVGIGVLALIRHNTGVGGVNIVALWLQKRRGWSVGRLHMMLDGLILLVAATALTPAQLGWSALSVVAINGILLAYHRPGRYLGH